VFIKYEEIRKINEGKGMERKKNADPRQLKTHPTVSPEAPEDITVSD
jgi:hypothetical protein